MCLTDIAMVAADTSRSRVYIQALVWQKMLPSFVLVLGNSHGKDRPGQLSGQQTTTYSSCHSEVDEFWNEANIELSKPIQQTLDENDIPHFVSATSDINDPSVIEAVSARPEPIFIYSGFGGVLLGSGILGAGKHFLHVHGGYLPDFKGSTTNYYSLISENSLGASAIFLTEKIDSGPVLLRRKFSPPTDRTEIDHKYDSAARAKVLVELLQKNLKTGRWEFEDTDNDGGETYYIIHPVLKHLAILGSDQRV